MADAGATSQGLLARLGNWRDDAAWEGFVARYEPFVRDCCRKYQLDRNETEELCQVVWITLARRMKTYKYDPSRTFRGWLRRLAESRAIDLLRGRSGAGVTLRIEDDPAVELRSLEEDEHENSPWLDAGVAIHNAVRARVEPKTWQAFWWIAVDGMSVKEAAEGLGMSYAAAFAAQKRVGIMLREEGCRFLSGASGAALA